MNLKLVSNVVYHAAADCCYLRLDLVDADKSVDDPNAVIAYSGLQLRNGNIPSKDEWIKALNALVKDISHEDVKIA